MTRRSFFNRAAPGAGIALAGGSARGSGDPEFRLWLGDDGELASAPYPHGIEHVLVHRALKGEFQYLHGPQIISYRGGLYTSWANSLVNENSSSETLRGRRSRDGGRTWSEIEVIAPNPEGRWRRSHGAFMLANDQLYALNSSFGNVSYEDLKVPIGIYEQSVEREGVVFEGLHTEYHRLDEWGDSWVSEGRLVDDFFPYHEPRRLNSGGWLMAGMDSGFRGAVATTDDPRALSGWKPQVIPVPKGHLYGEATCWVDGSQEVRVLLRDETPANKGGVKRVMISRSSDGGRTWSLAEPTNFPHTAKPHAGILSTGQRYLVSNSSGTSVRWPLTVAVGAPGRMTLRRNFMIRDGKTIQPRLQGKHKIQGWQYPGAWEYDGSLYVIYSVGKEDAEVAIIPVASLEI